MMKMNKQQKEGLIKGILVGFVIGAILPDNVNPVEILKDKLKNK